MMRFGGRGMRRGGGMPRTVGRVVSRTSVDVHGSGKQGPFSSSIVSSKLTRKPKSSNPVSLSSHDKNPMSGIPICDWVSVDGYEDDGARGFCSHCVVGPVPSENEVEDAVSTLQQVFGPASPVGIPGLLNQVSSDGSETDWAEPSSFLYNSKMLQANGSDRVYYAIHLLQTDPYVQRMVKSLSTDKAVWDAVLSNEVVQELRGSISADEEHVLQSPDGTANSDTLTPTSAVMWIFDTAKAQFMEVIEKIIKIVNKLFKLAVQKTAAYAEDTESFNEKLRTCFMLSIMVLLIVMVGRSNN